jgi:hypothetical protein
MKGETACLFLRDLLDFLDFGGHGLELGDLLFDLSDGIQNGLGLLGDWYFIPVMGGLVTLPPLDKGKRSWSGLM